MLEAKLNWKFYFGLILFVALVVFYFIKIEVDSGSNFTTYDSFLGIIIFHNPFILALYCLIVVVLIFIGIKKKGRQIRKS